METITPEVITPEVTADHGQATNRELFDEGMRVAAKLRASAADHGQKAREIGERLRREQAASIAEEIQGNEEMAQLLGGGRAVTTVERLTDSTDLPELALAPRFDFDELDGMNADERAARYQRLQADINAHFDAKKAAIIKGQEAAKPAAIKPAAAEPAKLPSASKARRNGPTVKELRIILRDAGIKGRYQRNGRRLLKADLLALATEHGLI